MWTSFDAYLDALRAIAEPTRLRLVRLCAQGELTVSELTRILGQSQPRVSRHLKLLQDAGLLTRFREQHWVFYRIPEDPQTAQWVAELLTAIPNDDEIDLDQRRLDEVRMARAKLSEAYVETEVPDWLKLHEFHGDEQRFADAVTHVLSDAPVGHLLDVATGTGRMLRIVGALAASGVGIDLSKKMVMVARSALAEAGLSHLTVRQEDMYQMRFPTNHFDTVTIDQVLYLASNPDALIAEAARVLKPTGRLLLVAFTAADRARVAAPKVSIRLEDITHWLTDAGLCIETHTTLPGSALDISLLVASPRTRTTA
ncbi:MAG: metalloregulator ArsR/SmtB family transcription factor [Litorivicinaceae bacterium]|jgi:DNA-binding transcriptional ArsR family regulator/protein-L-isoaspartate O-methyltransferase|nr:metalloregulator ArsR/SmtB family transcription factor [Litorivicinaceae bacterium]